MNIFRGFRLSRLILIIILVSLVSLTIIPLTGYCKDDSWVFVDSNEDYTTYYNPSSVVIDKQNNIYKIWVKYIYTTEGRNKLFNDNIGITKKDKIKYSDIRYSLSLFYFNYKDRKFIISNTIYYSKSGDIISNKNLTDSWSYVLPQTRHSFIFDNIIKNHNDLHHKSK